MKGNIFKRFTKNKKWYEYIDFKSFECQMSLSITVLFIILAVYFLDIHNNFNDYLVVLQNITIGIAQALIGMLGIILAGIAIIVGVLNKDVLKSIEKINGKDAVKPILSSFEFLAFNTGLGVMVFFLIDLILYSPKGLVGEFTFYLILAVISYFFLFLIFYTISLISNSIKFFFITGIYNDINDKEQNIYEIINELRIDYILSLVLKDTNTSKEEFLRDLNQFVSSSNIEDKEAVRAYLKKYYEG